MNGFERFKARTRQLKRETYALYLAYRDPRTPLGARLFAALVVAYAFSPIDLIPDFIPILGYLDDLVLIPLGVHIALKLIPPDVMNDARAKSAEMQNKPVNWIAAAFIVVIWLLLVLVGIVLIGRSAGIIR
jgi:uncharacterized membrane protein YkvA (DUF1232 family)